MALANHSLHPNQRGDLGEMDTTTMTNYSITLNNSILHTAHSNDTLTPLGIAELYEQMQKKTKLAKVCDLSLIKWRTNPTRCYLYVHRKSFSASTEAKLIDKLYEHFFGITNCTLETAYEAWLLWRRDTGTAPKTITENRNDWNRFLANSSLASMPVKNITVQDLEAFWCLISGQHRITYKRMSNVRSVLNGILKRQVSLGIIPHNPLNDVDYGQFKHRCKPQASKKDNYSAKERQAISFAFQVCLRIGELTAIKKEDIADGYLSVNRSVRRSQVLNDDLTFGAVTYTTEDRIKGNQAEGFRTIPLTDYALQLAEIAYHHNPDGAYLFMRDGKQLLGDTFNEHLKRVCNELDIHYRSSHQIRFTVATMLYENGLTVNELSPLLGHSDTRTTWHYIRQKRPDENTTRKMLQALG